jgi:transcription elongation factor Elf1
MLKCPTCKKTLEVSGIVDELDLGDQFSCEHCGADIELKAKNPPKIALADND